MTNYRLKCSAVIFMLLYAILFSKAGIASSIQPISFDKLCDDAEFIFEGRVISIQTQQDYISGNIWTYITFDVTDILKGANPGNTLALKFLGGSMNGISLNISDSVYPALNEHGIYFVESLTKNLVNPLLGWSQGHFIIQVDNTGTERILTNSLSPVINVDNLHSIYADTEGHAGDTLKNHLPSAALTNSEFKKIIHNNL